MYALSLESSALEIRGNNSYRNSFNNNEKNYNNYYNCKHKVFHDFRCEIGKITFVTIIKIVKQMKKI